MAKSLWLVHNGFDYEFEPIMAVFDNEEAADRYAAAFLAADVNATWPEPKVVEVPLFEGDRLPPSTVLYKRFLRFAPDGKLMYHGSSEEVVWLHAYRGDIPGDLEITKSMGEDSVAIFGISKADVALEASRQINERKRKND